MYVFIFILLTSLFNSWHQVWFKFFIFNCTRIVCVNNLEVWVDEFSLYWDSQFSNQISNFINGQTLTSIKIKVIKDFPEELRVILCKLENSCFNLCMQMLYCCLSNIRVFVFRNLPCSLHHSYEVFITRSAHSKVTVVILEFIPGNTSIVISTGSIKVI